MNEWGKGERVGWDRNERVEEGLRKRHKREGMTNRRKGGKEKDSKNVRSDRAE